MGRFVDFSADEEAMLNQALSALEQAGYNVDLFEELIRVQMPKGYCGMTLDNGAALGTEAFASQDCLNHVMEEEYLHLVQKKRGQAVTFAPGTALELELDVDDKRKFPRPDC